MSRTHKHPLRAFREANGLLSQADAAQLVGISQAMWSRLETGDTHASPKIARRIERLTGVSADSLMDLDDNELEAVSKGSKRLPRRFPKDIPKV